MGWLQEVVGTKKLLLGDEPIDILAEALESVATSYQEGCDRLPTMDELAESLKRVLNAAGADVSPDLQEQEVVGVTIRRRSIRRRQRYTSGDYFAIRISKGSYYYGRILLEGAIGHLVEVYKLKSDRLLTVPQLLSRKRDIAFHKWVYGRQAFANGRWRIIGSKPIPKTFKFPAFYSAFGTEIVRGRTRSPASRRRTRNLEPIMGFSPEIIEERLARGQFTSWPEIERAKKQDLDEVWR